MTNAKCLLILTFSMALLAFFVCSCSCGCGDDDDDDNCQICDTCENDDDDDADDDLNDDVNDDVDDDIDDDADDDTDDDVNDDVDDDVDDDTEDIKADIEYVAGGNFSGAALVMDSQDRANVITNKSRQMRLYYKQDSDWLYLVADEGVFSNPSAAIDDSDTLHLAYYDWFEAKLWYSTGSGDLWADEVVDENGDVGHYSAITLDGAGAAHIVYNEEISRVSQGLRYATNASGQWVIETVEAGVDIGAFPAITLDPDGNPYVTYNTADGIRLAHRYIGGWDNTDLAEALPSNRASGLDFDSSGTLHVIYHSNDAESKLRHAFGPFDNLQSEMIDGATPVGDTIAMDVDDNDIIHFTYYDNTATTVIYGNNIGGIWNLQTLGTGYPVFIKAKNADNIAISLSGIGVFRRAGTTWVQTYFDRPFAVIDTAITADSSGSVHLAFMDGTAQSIKYTNDQMDNWAFEIVASNIGADVQYIDLAVDSNGFAHISYYNGLNFKLGYATNASGEWITSLIDDSTFVGAHSSMVIDGNDILHVSYSDDANGDLKYANNEGGIWNVYTIEEEGLVGSWSDIAINDAGKIYIAYVDTSLNDIMLAVSSFAAWNKSIIGPDGGNYPSVALDSAGASHIAFVGAGLQHSYYGEDAWVVESVGPEALDMVTAISESENQRMSIAYQSLNWNLSFARQNAGGNWTNEVIDDVGKTGYYVNMTMGPNNRLWVSYVSHAALWLAQVY